MFTRCPQCGTVFRISATQLRVAGGDVRCGSCAHVFNALGLLTDEIPDSSQLPASSSTDPDEDVEFLADDPPEAENQPEQIADKDDGEESDLEFDAPEPTWSQFFIDATRKADGVADQQARADSDVALDGELETVTADPDEWRAFLKEMETPHPAGSSIAEDDDAAVIDPLGREPVAYTEDEEPTGELDEAVVTEFRDETTEVEQPVAADAINEGTDFLSETDEEPEVAWSPESWSPPDKDAETDSAAAPPWNAEETEESDPQRMRWLAASVAMLALLLLQVVHVYRDDIATSDRYGPQLRAIYTGLNLPLFPNWPLESYSVRRAEALAGGSAEEALDISAAVETSGTGSLGLPLVRVALRDQWANVVASRVFRPEQYLTAPLPEIVPAGTRIPVRLSLLDPGSEARGFVVDLCLPRRQGLDCQLARDPFLE